MPKERVSNSESGNGCRNEITKPVRSFPGIPGTGIYQVAVQEPEHEGTVERGNDFYGTSFMGDWFTLDQTGQPPATIANDKGTNPADTVGSVFTESHRRGPSPCPPHH